MIGSRLGERMAVFGNAAYLAECPIMGGAARQHGADMTHNRPLTPLPSPPNFGRWFIFANDRC